MISQFDKDCKYFAQISDDGKLKIWDVASNKLELDYTPDYHLKCPCTCLYFINSNPLKNKVGSPRKKKRRDSVVEYPNIVLGTSSGSLLLFSIAKGSIETTVNGDSNNVIHCLSTSDENIFFSGSDHNIVTWNLALKSSSSSWKAGNEKISSILVVGDSEQLITASKVIKLWNISTQNVLRTFTGHTSEISFLNLISSNSNGTYLVSGSKGDRLLSCWNIDDSNEKNAIANFLMDDTVTYVSSKICLDGTTKFCATVQSGAVHYYQHTLNGKILKPIKPKTTIQVALDTEQKNDVICPIHILAASFRDEDNICISYGQKTSIVFEDVDIKKSKKLQCLLRKDPRLVQVLEQKTRKPVLDNDAHYIIPHSNINDSTSKQRKDGTLEVPMEKRLENLTLKKLDDESAIPKGNNVAQLLLQGLHSKDSHIIKAALCKREDIVIRNTLKRLPMTVLVPLVRELTTLIQGKTISSQIGTLWLRHLIQIHAGLLISNPDLSNLFASALRTIESRLSMQVMLSRLKGRLDLLVSNTTATEEDSTEANEAMVLFNDKSSSDSEADLIDSDHSESELDWGEESGDEENIMENGTSMMDETNAT